jgi:hypothetical protein
MSYVGNNPKFTTQVYRPQSADPSNPIEGMVFRSDGTSRSKGLWEYRESNWQRFGSDAKTYVANYNIDSSTTSWATYADAAGAVPVDGTGGAPTTTFTFSSSTPLRGTGSGIITKDAANRQGEGISTDFTIDTADQGKVLQLSFDFTTSTNFVAADYRVFLYDKTNAVLIEGNARDLQANGGYGLYIGNFQTASNSTSYRLILHCATTNASAYTIKVDNFIFSPSQVAQGAIVTDWQAYTPIFTGFGSTSGAVAQWRRVGSSVEVEVSYTCGTPTGVEARVSLPSGMTIASTVTALTLVGFGDRNATAIGWNILASAGNTYFNMDQPNNTGIIARNGDLISGAGEVIKFKASVSISGWSSGVQLASQGTNQIISFKARLSANQSLSSSQAKITFDTVTGTTMGCFNKGGAFDTSNNRFVAPESGTYAFNYVLLANTDLTSGAAYTSQLRKNGTQFKNFRMWADEATAQYEGFGVAELIKGDYVEVYAAGDAAWNAIGGDAADSCVFEGWMVKGNQTIGMDEVVAASYTTNAGATFTDNGIVIFEDKVFDTHGAYDIATGIYTVPVAGKYFIEGKILTATVVGAVGEQVSIVFQKQGGSTVSLEGFRDYCQNTTTRPYNSVGSAIFDCLKGDTISVLAQENVTNVMTLSTSTQGNHVSILRIK